jgi:hypothetical protein
MVSFFLAPMFPNTASIKYLPELDKQKKWSFVNQHTEKSQFARPTSPATKPSKHPEITNHTATSSYVSSSAIPTAASSNETANGASKTPALTAPPRTASRARSSSATPGTTTATPIAPAKGPIAFDSAKWLANIAVKSDAISDYQNCSYRI